MTYTPEEKQQLVKYAKQAISIFPFSEDDCQCLLAGNELNLTMISKCCFDLAEAMVEEQRRRFGK